MNIFVYFSGEHKQSFFLGIHPGVDLPGQGVGVYLDLADTLPNSFSKWRCHSTLPLAAVRVSARPLPLGWGGVGQDSQ